MQPHEEQLAQKLREVAIALVRATSERDELVKRQNEPIAIVGIGCRLPGGVTDPESFWDLLSEGRDGIAPLEDRWKTFGVAPAADVPRWAGLLGSIDAFDAAFFGISPREAISLDPQQRLLLEITWETLEHAGIPPHTLAGSRAGVFVGACTTDYLQRAQRLPQAQVDAYVGTGNMLSVAAGRLSYTLGLQGPALTVDTACSSSLAAIHLACRSLRARECDLALAGGVSLLLSPDSTLILSRTQALSPDGRCRTFDAGANGYVRGEGCAMIALKRLADAQRDGDRVLALLRGSAMNQDGRSTGLTAPNVLAQQAVLREALAAAGLDASAIGFVETHGTGTSLGDAVEVEALRAVFASTKPGASVVLGAVKTNIGHLEGAAGVAGVVKAVLALGHERIPKNLNFRALNPRLRLPGSALALATEPVSWPRAATPRFAGVSSFGLSGTNVHVVIEEAPAPVSVDASSRPSHLLVLSAKSAKALRAQAARYAEHLARHPEQALSDVCFTAAAGRSHFAQRLAVVARSTEEMRAALIAYVEGKESAVVEGEVGDELELGPPPNLDGDLAAVAAYYVRGGEIAWSALFPAGRRVSLPTYAFQRQRFWIEGEGLVEKSALAAAPPAPDVARPEAPASTPLLARLRAASGERRREILLATLQKQAAEVLGRERVDPARPLSELGLESLEAVELRTLASASLGRTLPASLVFDYPTLDAIVGHLLKTLPLDDEPPSTAVAAEPAAIAAVTAPSQPGAEPIAIIGMGCRFPGGADDPESFWRLLSDGVDAIGEVPKERWDIDAWYDPNPDAVGKMTTRWGGFLRGVEEFDPFFFGISPREAASIDPQQRLLLEVSFEALERAGLTVDRLVGSDTGVYVGMCGADYQHRAFADATAIDAYSGLGSAHSSTAGRLSYFLGLKGPNFAVDTACSSSLVAVHLACQALRAGECNLALAGGANLVLAPEGTVYFSRLKAMSPTGRCRAFSADADGYVRGDGCGVVVLKRLADALRDGDPIVAVIRGTAVNQDGKSQGPTAPNGPSQEAVIRRALAQAGVRPAEVGFVECHGTGTPLGDPIEVQALAAALGEGRSPDLPLILGSVKTNIGHTEGAAGIAGLIKAALSLRHGRIPPNLHFTQPSPHIAWDELPIRVANQPIEWRKDKGSRIAGVSSFGISGTNAHVVLEEAPEIAAASSEEGESAELRPFIVTAQTASALRAQARRLGDHLAARPALRLADVAGSLATTRSQFEHRAVVVAKEREDLLEGLRAIAAGAPREGVVLGTTGDVASRLAFLFTGQGSQIPRMGHGLYTSDPVFRAHLDCIAAALAPHLERPLLEVMFAERGTPESELLNQTAFTQVGLFALELALARLLESWGVRPRVLLGHSVGELAAACFAGVFDLEDGCRLIAARARLMQALPPGGAMASIEAGEEEVRAAIAALALESTVDVAALNAPAQTTVSGELAAVESLERHFAAMGRGTNRLSVSHAFHSHRMEAMLDAYRTVADTVRYRTANIPIVSNRTGEIADPEAMANADYWVRQIREPVRFAAGVRAAQADGADVFVELGPQPVLSRLGEACLSDAEAVFLPSLRRGRPDTAVLLQTLARLHVRGIPVDWARYFETRTFTRVALPTYAFERRRYWLERSATRPPVAATSSPNIVSRGRTGVVAVPNDARTRQLVADLSRNNPDPVTVCPPGGTADEASLDTVVCLVPSANVARGDLAAFAERLWEIHRATSPTTSFVFASPVEPDPTAALFVDALAAHREKRGRPVTRVRWEPAEPPPSAAAAPIAPERPASPRDLTRSIMQTLRAEVARLLERDPAEVPVNKPIVDLGIDSLLATELRAAIQGRYSLKIATPALYNHPTIQRQAEYLSSLLAASTAEGHDDPVSAERSPADAGGADDLLARIGDVLGNGE